MAALVETLFYESSETNGRFVPWHKLGQPVPDALTSEDAIVAAGLDWNVDKKPIFDVFGNQISHLTIGLETALAQLGGNAGKIDAEVSRYWIGVLALSRKLNKNPEAKAELARRLQQLERQLPLYDNDILHEQMISNIASIYSDIISPMGTRIQVFGLQDLLSRTDIQNRVRASLLAGVRAGILWQQMGGSRWQFFFARKKLIQATQSLYSTR
jgi:high frequency lysogenization protein